MCLQGDLGNEWHHTFHTFHRVSKLATYRQCPTTSSTFPRLEISHISFRFITVFVKLVPIAALHQPPPQKTEWDKFSKNHFDLTNPKNDFFSTNSNDFTITNISKVPCRSVQIFGFFKQNFSLTLVKSKTNTVHLWAPRVSSDSNKNHELIKVAIANFTHQ